MQIYTQKLIQLILNAQNKLGSRDPVALKILNYKPINRGFIHLWDSIF